MHDVLGGKLSAAIVRALAYALSVAGRELLPVLDALEGWARRHELAAR